MSKNLQNNPQKIRQKFHVGIILSALFTTLSSAQAAVISTEQDGALSLYQSAQFQNRAGCKGCKILAVTMPGTIPATMPQAAWYFENSTVVVPKQGEKVAGFKQGLAAQKDLDAQAHLQDLPSLVWTGANHVIQQAKLKNGEMIDAIDGSAFTFELAPKIPSNLSYWNSTTHDFFENRMVRVRGNWTNSADKKLIANTVWPTDYRLDLNASVNALNTKETLKTLVQFEHGGGKSQYESRLLWARNPQQAKEVEGKAAVALMLNGAQGDDDESRGGHFAVVTGQMNAQGSYANWLVNNFYNLGSISEKGIIAAVTPMDKYLADTNSGQSYYRPSYMLVFTLKHPNAAQQYQAAINRVFNHFYRNDFLYDHSLANCAGVSIDTFRSLGWNIPQRGVENQLKATAAYFFVAASELNLKKARAIYDYLNTETTRLLPAVAFDAIGQDLMALVQAPTDKSIRPLSPYEPSLRDEVEAIYFVRIPQIPSSRATGFAPVYSFNQYMQEAPADHAQWKVVPTSARPFPQSLKNGDALKNQGPCLVPWPVGLVLAGLVLGLIALWKRWRK